MKEITLQSKITVCRQDELDADAGRLVRLAIKATDNSYVPYSHFHVGAAIRLANGMEIIGANQENAAYPVTLCAERTAVFAAQAQHPEQPVTAIAIAARNENGLLYNPISPCGSCRQVLTEIERRYKTPVKVYLYGTKCVYIIESAKELLPLCFTEDAMDE